MSYTVPTTEDYKFNVSVQLSVMNCGECGGTYAINERHREQCWNKNTGWNCPYCKCTWGYFGNTGARAQIECLERNLNAKTSEAKKAKHAVQALAKSQSRMRKRISAGMCPCCNRTFQNLYDHMRKQHPDFGPRDMFRTLRDTFGLTQAQLGEEIGVSSQYVSLYERGRHTPEWAVDKMKAWAEAQAA